MYLLLVFIFGLAWQATTLPLGEDQALANVEWNGEYGPHFEGDMILTEEQRLGFEGKQGYNDRKFRWPQNTLVYRIDPGFNANERRTIMDAMRFTSDTTCVRFVPRTTQTDYVNISRGAGCESTVGFQGGAQKMALNMTSCKTGNIAHEFLHSLGIKHEHTRSDRDTYVTINFQNIQKGSERQFEKINSTFSNFNLAYDYGSIMHYEATAFSANTKNTIDTKTKGAKIGQRARLSQKDINLVKKMYNCP